jgi:cytochrome oxidase Cu insertion factor (SCO1/SenC/PrrC family)
MRRRLILLAAGVTVAAAGGAAAALLTASGSNGAAGPGVTCAAGARRAPGFALRDEYGRPVSIAALRGRSILVTFIDPLCRNYCPL